ncbi:serine protease AprX [Oceanobacillus limi]|uniref:Serine protease AprX n=1 Tax=Oceanobacillus limi TaxID=930131 RepID=A0A1I0ERP3_9BACI|nr:S8 family peptidase [Oceanobacillus limi]SET48033.1 serine protease AprX [Oceanobacillus limi]
MSEFSTVQLIQRYSNKLDRKLRQELLELYHPSTSKPSIARSLIEKSLNRYKKFSVIAEFNDASCYVEGVKEAQSIVKKHSRCKMKHDYPSINSCCMELSPNAIGNLLDTCPHTKKLHIDHEVKALLDVATPSINALQVTDSDINITGRNTTIAIIDTGIYPHEDLKDHSGTTSKDRIIAFEDLVNHRKGPYDDNGHGTHCAGDAAGNGFSLNGKFASPAPDANLVGVKVLNRIGSGSLSTVTAGVQWCIDYNNNPNNTNKIDIISMSLGAPSTDEETPLEKIVREAWNKHGIVMCVAAGNEGPDAGTITSPGTVQEVITVGAIDDKNTVVRRDDEIADFSSRNTDNSPIKPDVVAPGTNIVSLRSPYSYLEILQKNNRIGSNYITLSGTSMATPICAGACAQIIEYTRRRGMELTPDELKQILVAGASLREEWENDRKTYGNGYINIQETISLI